MSTFRDWYESEPIASLINAWKQQNGYEGLEQEIERTEPLETTLERMAMPAQHSSRTFSLDPAGVVSSVLLHAYAHHRDGTALQEIDAMVRAANAFARDRYRAESGSIDTVTRAYESYLRTPSSRPIMTTIFFDPIGFAASSPDQTLETSRTIVDPSSIVLVPLGSGALLAGYDLATTLDLRAEQIEPIHFSRYKSGQNEPMIPPSQADRLREASRIVVFDEDTQTGTTLAMAARYLSVFGPVETATNGAPRFT